MTTFPERFESSGWAHLQAVFEPDLIDDVLAEIYRQNPELRSGQIRDSDRLIVGERRVQLPVRLAGALANPAVYANSALLVRIARLLGPDFLIDSILCIAALPGASDQEDHLDHNDLFQNDPGIRALLPPYAITVSIPLIDLSEETGATLLYSGSHKTAPADAELPLGSRGDAFLIDYRLWHRGTANRSKLVRPLLYIVYSRPWFTDSTNSVKHARFLIDDRQLASIPVPYRKLFRRLAAKGARDCQLEELFQQRDTRG